jgi:hypothetical protein
VLSKEPEYCPEKGDRGEKGLYRILLETKPEDFVFEIMLEGIRVRTMTSGLKLHAVCPIKSDVDLM